MYTAVFKFLLFALVAWVVYAYLTGHPSRDFVTRTIKNSARLSKSRATLFIWWGLIATGAAWLLYEFLK
jgi:hypothetical protein